VSQQNKSPSLSLVSVWLVDLINELGWRVTRYRGPDAILNQGHDVRDVLRAELKPDGINLVLELCGFVGATGTRHKLFLPFAGPDKKESVAAHFFFRKEERIMVHWTESDPDSGAVVGCLVELTKP